MVQNLITTVPTGTHQFLAGTTVPRDYGIRWNTTYLKYLRWQQPLCHSVIIFAGNCNVVHSGQHFPHLRNLFKPKSQDTSTLPKWQSGHSTNLGSQIPIISNTKLVLRNTILSHNGKLVKPTSGMILEFLKRQFVPLGSAIVKSFAFCFLKGSVK